MTHEDDMVTPLAAGSIARTERRLSPRVAFQISLGLHALFALVMFRLYSEYVCEPHPEVHLVVRASHSKPAATPSFVTTHVAAADATDQSIRPSAAVEPLPHRSPSSVATTITPLRPTQTGLRRSTLPATLPSTAPIVSSNTIAAVGEPQPPAGDAATPASRVTLQRTEVLPDMPLRIASRPVYDRREQRPLGLAALPAASMDQPVRQPADAFAHRFVAKRTPPENRTAIDRGLEFLARIQQGDGRWRFDDLRDAAPAFPQPTSLRSDAAATGLALLAFLGVGHDHFDGRYHAVIQDGIEFLLRIEQLDGNFFVSDDRTATGSISSFYSHGIATLALSEAYGMTGDARLQGAAQRALDSLAERLESEPLTASDWAVFGWQLATLRSGQLAGLDVDSATLARIADRLAAAQRTTTTADATSATVGLAVELHLARATRTATLRPTAQRRRANSPDDREPAAREELQRDSYYCYFGSQAMYYLGGDDWQSWADELYPRLIQSQLADGPWAGSWQPPTDARDDVATRLYITAMNLLSLETEQRQPHR